MTSTQDTSSSSAATQTLQSVDPNRRTPWEQTFLPDQMTGPTFLQVESPPVAVDQQRFNPDNLRRRIIVEETFHCERYDPDKGSKVEYSELNKLRFLQTYTYRNDLNKWERNPDFDPEATGEATDEYYTTRRHVVFEFMFKKTLLNLYKNDSKCTIVSEDEILGNPDSMIARDLNLHFYKWLSFIESKVERSPVWLMDDRTQIKSRTVNVSLCHMKGRSDHKHWIIKRATVDYNHWLRSYTVRDTADFVMGNRDTNELRYYEKVVIRAMSMCYHIRCLCDESIGCNWCVYNLSSYGLGHRDDDWKYNEYYEMNRKLQNDHGSDNDDGGCDIDGSDNTGRTCDI